MKVFFLEDEIIGLRALTLEDCENDYLDWFNDKEVCRFNDHHRYPSTKDSILSFVSELYRDNSKIVCAVEEKETQKHIGNISLQGIDYINRGAEIAFIFGDKEYWGRGYASRAAKLLINHAFMELGLNRIFFGTSDENIGMQKVGEKLGFARVGIRRSALFKNGSFHDVYDYDILRNEWVD